MKFQASLVYRGEQRKNKRRRGPVVVDTALITALTAEAGRSELQANLVYRENSKSIVARPWLKNKE